MTKSRLFLLFLMTGVALVGCKKFRNRGLSALDAGMINTTSASAAMSAAPMASASAAASAAMPDTTTGGGDGAGSCGKAVKCCKVLSGDTNAGCDALTRAPEVTCATTLTSYRKAVKATKPKRLSECD